MTREALAARRKQGAFSLMKFTGDNNRFELSDVTIEVDTSIRGIGRPPVHTNEFVFSGSGNTISGLTITNVGEGLSSGGAVVSNTGDKNKFKNVTLHLQGSRPYGYGDLFGKGGYKQSGFQLTGDDNRLIGFRLFMKSFGHGFFIQHGAANNVLEDCYVEGEMRSTDQMLAEKTGIAFDREFRTSLKNRDGIARITPGYIKSLAEDGFRTYDDIPGLTLRNCTAKNMRGGFEIRTKSGAQIENCRAIGCERGFWIADHSTLKNCRGDAKYGPLLFVEGKQASVEIALLGDESEKTVHSLATVCGSRHRIRITKAEESRESPLPILLGYGAPPAGEAMAPYSEKETNDVPIDNETRMPTELGRLARNCTLRSAGPVAKNLGTNNSTQ